MGRRPSARNAGDAAARRPCAHRREAVGDGQGARAGCGRGWWAQSALRVCRHLQLPTSTSPLTPNSPTEKRLWALDADADAGRDIFSMLSASSLPTPILILCFRRRLTRACPHNISRLQHFYALNTSTPAVRENSASLPAQRTSVTEIRWQIATFLVAGAAGDERVRAHVTALRARRRLGCARRCAWAATESEASVGGGGGVHSAESDAHAKANGNGTVTVYACAESPQTPPRAARTSTRSCARCCACKRP